MSTHAIQGLVTKRRELASRIDELRRELVALEHDLSTLDGAIKIIDPGFDLRTIRPKRRVRANKFFANGEASRFVLSVLREAREPISTYDIADLAVAKKGFVDPDIKALRACILTTLSRQRKKGVVVEMGRDEAGTISWALASN